MNMYLKKATDEECDILFEWTNEELVRKNSFSTKLISYEEHVKWFKTKVNSCNSTIFIFYVTEVPAGQVRIDVEDETAVISYSLDKRYRGKGLSIEMLKLLEKEINKGNSDIKKLVGYVKVENQASQKIFEKLDYFKELVDSGIRYYKNLK